VGWLTSLPAGVLVAGWLGFGLVVAFGARLAVRTLVPACEHDQVHRVASPLMPALGAAFGVLIAVTLAGEAGYLKSAQDIVADEASAGSRLAWAATGPGVRTEPIHAALLEYLEATQATEWHGSDAEDGSPAVADALAQLEHVVRTEAARPELGTPTSTELLVSLDAVTTSRRERLAAAARQLPVLYVITLIAGGMALIANAAALTARTSLRVWLLVAALATVVALSLALLISLTAPWQGPLKTTPHPLKTLTQNLETAYFT
jgi:hypothetical protein